MRHEQPGRAFQSAAKPSPKINFKTYASVYDSLFCDVKCLFISYTSANDGSRINCAIRGDVAVSMSSGTFWPLVM